VETAAMELQSTVNGRPIKFTPERLDQIRNLIERGKTREEIANIIGSTVNSLQVTCSRMGISLRPPKGSSPKPKATPMVVEQFPLTPRLPPSPMRSRAKIGLTIDYQNQTRATTLPFDDDAIVKLILEAHIRGLSLHEFLAETISKLVETDLLDEVMRR
jgi:hypothetical protein